DEDWDSGFGRAVAVFLNGEGLREVDARGQRVTDDSFFLAFNADADAIEFTLPDAAFGEQWEIVIDTENPTPVEADFVPAGGVIKVGGRSVVVLRRVATG